MKRRPEVAIRHLHQVVKNEAKPAQTQTVELLEHGRAVGRIDTIEPGDFPRHRLDRRTVEVRQQLRRQRLVQAHQHDGCLANREIASDTASRSAPREPGLADDGAAISRLMVGGRRSSANVAGRLPYESSSSDAASLPRPALKDTGGGFGIAADQLANPFRRTGSEAEST